MAIKHTHVLSGTGSFSFEDLSQLVEAVSASVGTSYDWQDDVAVHIETNERAVGGERLHDWAIEVSW